MERLESVSVVVESTESPKIKAGASSSSALLNKFHDAIRRDISSLVVFANQLSTKVSQFANTTVAQSSGVNSAVNDLVTRINALETSVSSICCSFFNSRYISAIPIEVDAEVDTVFGYITLPKQSSTNLLVQYDSFNNLIMSNEIKFAFSYDADPLTGNFIEDVSGLTMLLRKDFWSATRSADIWVRLKIPIQYSGLNPNVIEIFPLPCFSQDLKEVRVRPLNSTLSDLVTLDLSYVPTYDAGSSSVPNMGPVKLFVDEPFSEVFIRLSPKDSTVYPGLYNLKIVSETYDQTGFVNVIDPNGRNFTGVTLYGKDNIELAALPISGSGSKIRVDLSSIDSFKTPVITKIIGDLT